MGLLFIESSPISMVSVSAGVGRKANGTLQIWGGGFAPVFNSCNKKKEQSATSPTGDSFPMGHYFLTNSLVRRPCR